ncbi:cingulin isoform X4 [Hydra vulgaris]|uniref:Cingulin isoform X4 n=1 Tax=Hydra vulgaris TaxID=6087 RepID=A0ABM4CCJ0_HYDVU
MTENSNETHLVTENEKTTENFKELLDNLRVEVTTNLDIHRQFIFSYLISKKVLDEEDCEQIMNSGVTRQQKVCCFIDIIRRKGSSGIKHFIDALEYENPALYKAFTGKSATKFIAPLILSGRAWDCISGLSAKEYVDSDRAILSSQLEQRIKDYHCMVIQLNRSIEEKNIVEKNLMTAQLKIDDLQKNIEKLKVHYQKNPKSVETKNVLLSKLQEEEIRSKFYDKLARHDSMTIALQSKLLELLDEISKKNNECIHIKEENKKIKKMADEIKLKFSFHRKVMRMYSEHNFNANSSSAEEIKEMQLKFQRTAEELETLKGEFDEFVKYSDMLNTKFKMLLKENSELKDYSRQISWGFKNMALDNEQSKSRCEEMEWNYTFLKDQNAILEAEVKMYQDIQAAHKFDCDRLLEDKDKLYNAIADSKKKTEEGLRKQIDVNKTLEENYRKIAIELESVKNTLQQTVKELNEAKSLLKLVSKTNQFSAYESKNEEKENDIESSSISGFCARKHSYKELLNSIRRKFPEDSVSRLMSLQKVRLLSPTYLNTNPSDLVSTSEYSNSLSTLNNEKLDKGLSKSSSNDFMHLTPEDELHTNQSPVFRRRAMLVEEEDLICRSKIKRKTLPS